MANYLPPDIKSLSFKFTTGGYTKPSFDNIKFNSGLRPSYSSAADLKASIEVMQLYQTSTYSYLKECKTIIVGYGANGIQTLQLPCLYGGIRDLGSYLNVQPPNVDLQANIFALYNFLNLSGFVRPTIKDNKDLSMFSRSTFSESKDLASFTHGYLGLHIEKDLLMFARPAFREPKDLLMFSRPVFRESKDLSLFARTVFRQSKDLASFLHGYFGVQIEKDLLVDVYAIAPKDLLAYIDILDVSNLQAYIEGVYLKSSKDLAILFGKLKIKTSTNLKVLISGWASGDLSATIVAFWKKNLVADIVAGHFKQPRNLNAYLNTIQPKNLSANLHGYDTLNLLTNISTRAFGPYDLQGVLELVRPKNLYANIHGFLGLNKTKDLLSYITGFYVENLNAFIQTIEAKNLQAYIISGGFFLDLSARIVPKVISIKRLISIPLMEHKDLLAVVNYSCISSSYRNLAAYAYALMKKDLKASIIGWKSGTADNIRDLAAHINYRDYSVNDTFNIKGIVKNKSTYNVSHNISGGHKEFYKTIDTYSIVGGDGISNLTSYINGILHTYDLQANITAEYLILGLTINKRDAKYDTTIFPDNSRPLKVEI